MLQQSATRTPQTIGVQVCSFRRPDSLLRLLRALAIQTRAPDHVVIVLRADDAASQLAVAERQADGLPVRTVIVSRPGTVHALNRGLDNARADIVCITDDDTAPWPDWLARILAHFQAEPTIGGLGGRDWMHEQGRRDEGTRDVVGKIQWFGRVIGNHHLGHGPARPVDVLKGANMSYRAEAFATIRFDRRLRGTGAQPSEDSSFSMAVRRVGWMLVYDPAVAVEHYSGERSEPRHYSGIVKQADTGGLITFAHNDAVSMLSGLPTMRQRAAYLAYSALVGTKIAPGLLQAVLLSRTLGLSSWRRFLLIQRGKLAGVMTVLKNPRRP